MQLSVRALLNTIHKATGFQCGTFDFYVFLIM